MSNRDNERGEAGHNVAANVRHFRETGKRWTAVDLSNRLAEIGWPLSPPALRRLEDGDRRVDADDLVALAQALDVSVIELLSTPGEPYHGPGSAQWRDEIEAMRQAEAERERKRQEFDQMMLGRVQRIEQALTAAKVAGVDTDALVAEAVADGNR